MNRIYLVDDHVIVREGLRALLQAHGQEVVGEAGDFATARDEIQALAPDVVLLDLGLGQVSGLELLAHLQSAQSPLRVIVLTVSERPHDVAEALRMGAAGYLLKGASAADLLDAIDAVRAGGRAVDDHLVGQARQEAAPGSDGLSVLSERERQVMRMVVGGLSSAAIATQLHLSPKTVDTYRSRLMAKLGVHDVTGLVRLAVKTGVIDAG